MRAATTNKSKSNAGAANTVQEIFVCLSILLYSIFWLPICMNKYPNHKVVTSLDILTFSYLSSIVCCSLYLIAIFMGHKMYERASPIFLALSIVICVFAQFMFNKEYCTEFFASNYGSCYISEFLSFFIYILCCYYFMSISLARTKFKFATADLHKIKSWFGSHVRGYILLIINISMLIIIFIHVHMYSYFQALHSVLNVFDIIWVALVTILAIISIVMRFQKCIPIIAHKWLLVVLIIISCVAFGIGSATVWKYKLSTSDGFARIGNVFIWCVVNVWVLLEFMTVDINQIAINTLRFSNVSTLSVNDIQSEQQSQQHK